MYSTPDGALYQVWAPAKINLFFEVLGKRPDGYHDIETLVAPISLYDRLEFFVDFDSEPGVSLQIFDSLGRPEPSIPADDTNLVAKAYHVFCAEIRKASSQNKLFNIRAKIFKKIPSKAGLGGGSSDALAALSVFNTISGHFFSKSELSELAGRLGSDVPLFLEDGASIGRGRGELVEPFDLPELWTVVVKPKFGLSTPDVYRRHSSVSHSERRSLEDVLSAIGGYKGDDVASLVAGLISNRLEESASSLWDGVARWKSVLESTEGALAAQMTGSGTAFFALYPNESAAIGARSSICALVNQDSSELLQIEDVFVAKTLTTSVQP